MTHHLPMHAVSDTKRMRRRPKSGAYTKTLFLRNTNGSMRLVTPPKDSSLDLSMIADHLKTDLLSFC